ncbi:MAG: nucleotide exchange factor GrpE [Candidatus Kaiserbacteria bacterium]|nr:nucleotide exchange factor GrpE [Candidatus Kaiserbacteria bacterium]
MAAKKKKEDAKEEVVFEDVAEATNGALEKAKKALKACEKERKEYLDGWKRAKADALNEKKRQKEVLERERSIALQGCVMTILPMIDSIRAALSQASDTAAAQSGVKQIHTQCLRSFSDLGVTLIDTVGEPFDPLRHQSVGEQEVADKKKSGTVTEVMRAGATVGDTVIRPAMVSVGVCAKDVDK